MKSRAALAAAFVSTGVLGPLLVPSLNQIEAVQVPKVYPPIVSEMKVIHQAPMRNSRIKQSRVKQVCQNDLYGLLYRAGFRGENLREAWAITMRESRGRNIGPGDPEYNGEDWGIVQLNKPTWGHEPWWDDDKILDPEYSARVMFEMSKGGTTWEAWGLTGDGQLDTTMYRSWSAAQQQAWIIEPYQEWYQQYPC